MRLSRRNALLGLLTAPVTAGAVAKETMAKMSSVSSVAGLSGTMGQSAIIRSGRSQSFTTWAEYFTAERDEDAKHQARRNAASCLDPDILCMNWPLATKVRAQTERNYKRLISESRHWFDRMLRQQAE